MFSYKTVCYWFLGWPVKHKWVTIKIGVGKTWLEKNGSITISYTKMYWHWKCTHCNIICTSGGKKRRYWRKNG